MQLSLLICTVFIVSCEAIKLTPIEHFPYWMLQIRTTIDYEAKLLCSKAPEEWCYNIHYMFGYRETDKKAKSILIRRTQTVCTKDQMVYIKEHFMEYPPVQRHIVFAVINHSCSSKEKHGPGHYRLPRILLSKFKPNTDSLGLSLFNRGYPTTHPDDQKSNEDE